MPCAGQIRRVIFCLAFLPTLGGRTGVLCCRRGEKEPPSLGGRCLAGLCSLGSTRCPPERPGTRGSWFNQGYCPHGHSDEEGAVTWDHL